MDKAIIAVCCLGTLALASWSNMLVVVLLVAVAASACAEVLPSRVRFVAPAVYVVLALVVAECVLFLPLAAYDLARDKRSLVRVAWAVPALAAVARLPYSSTVLALCLCVVACLLARRTEQGLRERERLRRMRDDVRETSLALEERNRDLCEKQDMDVKLAMLSERSRIAREIHDNVGHLLTRSIMQVEALQVVYRENAQVKDDLAAVGNTLHEAMTTVRASVHDLHDEAFDLATQIETAARVCEGLQVDVDYQADEVPLVVGYCFISVVREALSNTVRHSDASQASISVTEYPAFFRLVVHDNGSKPADGAAEHAGMGLAAMEERARALGGVFRAGYDGGFSVLVTVPKDAADAAKGEAREGKGEWA